MARSGRRTRTVLIADRLTLCPSSEYSSILQKSKKPLLCHWNYDQLDLGQPWTSAGNPAENSAPFLGYRGFSYQSLRSTSLRTKWCHCHSTELYTLTPPPPTPTHTHTWHLTGIKQVSKLYTKHTHIYTHIWLRFNVIYGHVHVRVQVCVNVCVSVRERKRRPLTPL